MTPPFGRPSRSSSSSTIEPAFVPCHGHVQQGHGLSSLGPARPNGGDRLAANSSGMRGRGRDSGSRLAAQASDRLHRMARQWRPTPASGVTPAEQTDGPVDADPWRLVLDDAGPVATAPAAGQAGAGAQCRSSDIRAVEPVRTARHRGAGCCRAGHHRLVVVVEAVRGQWPSRPRWWPRGRHSRSSRQPRHPRLAHPGRLRHPRRPRHRR